MADDAGPFDRQAALQAEAVEVRAALHLDDLLREVGDPVVVGSAALGLMVWRDLDVTVSCRTLDVGPVLRVATCLASHGDVGAVTFRNDTGRWNGQPQTYPDGLYVGVRYQPEGRPEWRLDLWFVSEPERQPDLRHLVTVRPRLTDEVRAAILTIKSAWHRRPEYGATVRSWDVYRAVLDDGVRTTAEFDAWLRGRRDASPSPAGE